MLLNYESWIDLLNSGTFYGYGRDRALRPILIFNVRRWVDHGETDTDRVVNLIEIMTFYLQINGNIDGKIESFNTFVDVTNVGIVEMPYSATAKMA